MELDDRINALSHQVIGAALEVHSKLGPGFLESVYEAALSLELSLRGIPHKRQVGLDVLYKGRRVGRGRVDLVVDGQLVVELKAVEGILPIHQAQVISYLRALRLPLGLILNFNRTVLRAGIKRVILSA